MNTAETLIVADGFSCREQIAQGTHRKAMHLAQVLQMALDGSGSTIKPFPERDYLAQPADHRLRTAVLLGSGLLFAGWMMRKVWGKKVR